MNEYLKILILEDNLFDAGLLENELKKSGLPFLSELAQTRETFENALEEFNPHIILSDYSLPSFNGLEAFHIKQNKYPAIPFIIVSGTIGEENAVELIKIGINDYVLKDNLISLPQKITRALNDAEKIKEKEFADEILKSKNEKLLEIAFLQSHQVRVPIVHILGLFEMFNFDDTSDPVNVEIFQKLKTVANEFDLVIREITEKTNDIKNIIP